jgi:serine phosphatase RsbU (regulator of sigma subunit)
MAFTSASITEANNPQQEEFGSRRLEKILRENAQRPPQEIVNQVFAELRDFEAGRTQRDDQTLVVLKIR